MRREDQGGTLVVALFRPGSEDQNLIREPDVLLLFRGDADFGGHLKGVLGSGDTGRDRKIVVILNGGAAYVDAPDEAALSLDKEQFVASRLDDLALKDAEDTGIS
jgi:hypothetical protein